MPANSVVCLNFCSANNKSGFNEIASPTALVVITHVNFGQQAQSKQLHSGDDENRGEDQQRTVLNHDMDSIEYAGYQQAEADDIADEDSEEARGAEEMQGSREVVKQETNCDQIEEHG